MRQRLLLAFLTLASLYFPLTLSGEYLRDDEKYKDVALYQNYPNPCEYYTIIRYHAPVGSVVNIRIYNILGDVISYPIKNSVVSFSDNSINVDTRLFASGIYFYELSIDNKLVMVKKMAVVK